MDEEFTLLESTDAILQELGEDDLLPCGFPFACSTEAVRQTVDESAMTADFVIVTRQKDINRNGHVVQIVEGDGGRGIVLDNYQHNPVVLFNHGFPLPFPIGRSSLPKLSKTKATATATFSQVNPDAAVVFGLIAEGILNTSSVAFLPLKARAFKVKQKELGEDEYDFRPYRSFDFVESDLLEWSVVDVPADPHAVRKHLDRGHVHGDRISRTMRLALERSCPAPEKKSDPTPEEKRRQEQAAWHDAVKQSLNEAMKKTPERIEAEVRDMLTTPVERLAAELKRICGR